MLFHALTCCGPWLGNRGDTGREARSTREDGYRHVWRRSAHVWMSDDGAFCAAREQSAGALCNLHNQCWNDVKRATQGIYPHDWAANTDTWSLTDWSPSPSYEHTADVHGGYGELVEDPATVVPALRRGCKAVGEEKRQAILNIVYTHPLTKVGVHQALACASSAAGGVGVGRMVIIS